MAGDDRVGSPSQLAQRRDVGVVILEVLPNPRARPGGTDRARGLRASTRPAGRCQRRPPAGHCLGDGYPPELAASRWPGSTCSSHSRGQRAVPVRGPSRARSPQPPGRSPPAPLGRPLQGAAGITVKGAVALHIRTRQALDLPPASMDRHVARRPSDSRTRSGGKEPHAWNPPWPTSALALSSSSPPLHGARGPRGPSTRPAGGPG